MRRLSVVLLILILFIVPTVRAQTDQRCFTETNQCISGRIREFWEQNGGLAVFGFPTGPQQETMIEGKPFQAQTFERNRLELHPENQRPYDVLLGRLGVDRLAQQGRDWNTFPKADPGAPHYYAQTGHAIAPQFWGYWSSHGLEFDRKKGKSEAESLALVGLPLSEPVMETNASGATVLTQWFERARFEAHPENKPPYDILLGLLGNELRDNAAPAPPPQPTPTPVPPGPIAVPNAPCDKNAPAPAEGAQAWITIPTPARRSDTTLCVRLVVGGKIVAGATASGVAHYKTTNTALGPAATGGDGVAAITFNVGGPTPGYTVAVDVTVAANGQTYHAQTSFTPQ